MKSSLHFLRSFLFGIGFWMLLPCFAGGISHWTTFGGLAEQRWLDQAIEHLVALDQKCTDPDLRGVLAYTIERYNRIGPFDVAVTRIWQWLSDDYVMGINHPLLPGLTLDVDVLALPIHDGALILVHEALHDYWPCLGHAHITPRMNKLEAL